MDAEEVALLREVLAGTDWLQATRRFAGVLRASVGAHGGGLLLVGSEGHEPWHLAAHLAAEAAWCHLPELSPTLVRHWAPPGAPAHLAVDLTRLEQAGRGDTLLVVAPRPPGGGLLERVDDARRSGATVLTLDGPSTSAPRSTSHRPWAVGEPCGGHRRDLGLPDRGLGAPDREAPSVGAGARSAGAAGGGGAGDRAGSAVADGAGFAELRSLAHDALTGEDAGLALDAVQHLVSAAVGDTPPLTGAGRRRLRDRLSRLADRFTAPPPDRW